MAMYKGLIDNSLGMQYCGDSESIYREMLTLFCEQYPTVEKELTEYVANRDWERYTIKVHGLKSNARNIGAEVLGARCFELETAGKALQCGEKSATQAAFIESKHPEMMELYARTIEAAKEYIRERI